MAIPSVNILKFLEPPRYTTPPSTLISSPDVPRGSSNSVDCPTSTHHLLSASLCCSRGISVLREALDDLDSKMASLLKQRRELELHLEQAARSRSPVQRLPSELLSWIFVMGVDDGDPVMVSALMLVCRYWADVAVNTPILWSMISVNFQYSLDKVRRKLVRSNSVPLDITINFNPRLNLEDSRTLEESITHVMDLIRPELWRTKSFRLNVRNQHQLDAVLSQCQGDAPLLEALSILVCHSMPGDFHTTPQILLFNGHTPRLQSCSFTSFNFGWDVTVVSRLRVLRLGGYFNQFSPSVDELMEVLRQCTELEELTLRNMSDVDPDECSSLEEKVETYKVLQLPRLVKASFYYAGITRTHALLEQISFPALESLGFSYLGDLTPVLQHLETQSHTSLPLRYLRIESTSFNDLELINLLRRLPSLVTLELIDASSHLLKGLSTPPASQPWICPKLIVLNLDGSTSLDWDSLRTFIESRLPINSYRHHYSLHPIAHPPSTEHDSPTPASAPQRLRSIDVTRCHISNEMLQWLRMYVSDVRCQPGKGDWGELDLF